MRRPFVTALLFPVMLLLFGCLHPSPLAAQKQPTAAEIASAKQLEVALRPLPTPTCIIKAPGDSLLLVSLPDTVLDYLEQVQRSAFVHAFLLGFVADSAAGHHRVSECARAFLRANPSNADSLLRSYVDAPAIIAALRQAEGRRISLSKIADSTQMAASLITRLTRDTSSGNLVSVWTQIRGLCSTGPHAPGACERLDAVIGAVDSFHSARARRDTAQEGMRLTSTAAAQARDELTKLSTDPAADTIRGLAIVDSVRSVVTALQDASVVNGDTTGRTVRLQIANDTLDSMTLALSALRSRWKRAADLARATQASAENAERAFHEASARTDDAYHQVKVALNNIEATLDSIPTLKKNLRLVETTNEVARRAPILVPNSLQPAPRASVPPGSILLALTDFIIARAEREVVNSFIVKLHQVIRKEPILIASFPESWAMMQGIPVHRDGVLDAVEVGRIPLTTWRATLATDFASFPVNLVASGPDTLCMDPGLPLVAGLPHMLLTGCARRVAMLQPVGAFARKLADGEPLLDILRGADSLLEQPAGALPPDWHRLAQGLAVLASVADAFAIQGRETGADVVHHPYILSVAALSGVTARQRSAFMRVLILRAVRVAGDLPHQFPDTVALYGAIANGARVVDLLATTRSDSSSPDRAQLAQLVHASFEAMGSAVWIAQLWGTDPGVFDSTRMRWRAFGNTVEPIIAGDFGLALSRSIVLLRSVRGLPVPNSVITLTSLASSLSESRDAEQMRLAFEAAAAPSGGWQAKRYGVGGATITAYPGINVSRERVIARGGDPSGTGSGTLAVGSFLPVGIEWMKNDGSVIGRSERECTWRVFCGWGLYMPVIDIGALMTYRVGGADSVQAEPNTTLRQVFAPGLYISLPFTRTLPATFLLGGQFVPALRTVETRTEGTTASRSAWRIGGGLALDLMLFHF